MLSSRGNDTMLSLSMLINIEIAVPKEIQSFIKIFDISAKDFKRLFVEPISY